MFQFILSDFLSLFEIIHRKRVQSMGSSFRPGWVIALKSADVAVIARWSDCSGVESTLGEWRLHEWNVDR
jgi:hypothetical protein